MKTIASVALLASLVAARPLGGDRRRPTLMSAHPENNAAAAEDRLLLDVGTLMSAREPGFEFEVHLPSGLSVVAKSDAVKRTHRGQYYGHYHADGSPMFPSDRDAELLGASDGVIEVPARAAYGAWHITSPVIDSSVPQGERLFSAEEATDLLHLHHTDDGRVHGFLDVDGRRTLLKTNEEGELVAEPTGTGKYGVHTDILDEEDLVAELLEEHDNATPRRAQPDRSISLQQSTATELKIAIYAICSNGVIVSSQQEVIDNLDQALRQSLIGEQNIFPGNRLTIVAFCHLNSRFIVPSSALQARSRLRNFFEGISTGGRVLRDDGNQDIVMLLYPFPEDCGFAPVTNFYRGSGWNASGANPGSAYGVVDDDCAIGEHAFVKVLGHIMGFRENRLADDGDFDLENHGGAAFNPQGLQCTPTVMSSTDPNLSVCGNFVENGRSFLFSTRSQHLDFLNGAFINNTDCRRHHLDSLVEIAKYR